ncbi:hypothetical protein ACL655_28320, partial [Klebsiella quasipneumoniae subsp. similipneumoniae]
QMCIRDSSRNIVKNSPPGAMPILLLWINPPPLSSPLLREKKAEIPLAAPNRIFTGRLSFLFYTH